MTREIPLSKAQRLSRISHLLDRGPRGRTTAEIPQLCGVTKPSIQGDLHDVEEISIPLWEDEGHPPRYGIIEGYYLPRISFTAIRHLGHTLALGDAIRPAGLIP